MADLKKEIAKEGQDIHYIAERPESSAARAAAGNAARVLWLLNGLVLLALFLPVHFYVLASAIDGAARLDGFLRWTEQPLVKFAEAALILLLAAHLTGGLRLLFLEFVGCRGVRLDLRPVGVEVGDILADADAVVFPAGVAVALALLFLVNAA